LTTPSTDKPVTAPGDQSRVHLLELVGAIEPWDALERTHLKTVTQWIASGTPIYRLGKPDVPAMHLVSYFVVLDDVRGQLLLVAHRKAGLWLPAGGHVEPGESPWAAVVRECREELGIEAVASPITGERPLFLTVTQTRGQNAHTDVSLWFLLTADPDTITSYDQGEFDAIRWLTDEQVLQEPDELLDPTCTASPASCSTPGPGGIAGNLLRPCAVPHALPQRHEAETSTVLYLTAWTPLSPWRQRRSGHLGVWFRGLVDGLRGGYGERAPMTWRTVAASRSPVVRRSCGARPPPPAACAGWCRGGRRGLVRGGGAVGRQTDLVWVDAGRLSSEGVPMPVGRIERCLAGGPVVDHEALARVFQRGADPAQAVVRVGIGMGRYTLHAVGA
jgi:8-oxo-dGTP pyrophosphatase MutT (NUDIX family)